MRWGRLYEEQFFWGELELNFTKVKLEVPVGHLRGDVEQTDRHAGGEFSGEVWGNINLGFISICMKFRGLRMDEITMIGSRDKGTKMQKNRTLVQFLQY